MEAGSSELGRRTSHSTDAWRRNHGDYMAGRRSADVLEFKLDQLDDLTTVEDRAA